MSQLTADHAGGHAHPAHLAHHFDSPGQQFSSGKLGMWLFLATEVLFFGGLFCAYAIYRGNHPEIFEAGAKATDWKMGAANTVILILSSLSMATAVTAVQKGKQTLLKVMLLLTILGGIGFMGIKFFEYKHKIEIGARWGAAFNASLADAHGEDAGHADDEGAAADNAGSDAAGEGHETGGDNAGDQSLADASAQENEAGAIDLNEYLSATVPIDHSQYGPSSRGSPGMAPPPPAPDHEFSPDSPKLTAVYFSIYFGMTGLHGIHVLVGIVFISMLFWRACKGWYGPGYFTPVDLGGLYWHLVDLIWIFLFPLLYLI